MGGDEFKDARPSYQNIENKLLNQSGDEACIIQRSTRQGNIIFRKTLSISDASQKKNSTTKSQNVQLRGAALVLREIILSRESNPLPENLKIDSVLHGTTNIPQNVAIFFNI